MKLKNTREPFNAVEFDEDTEAGAGWLEYYRAHGYSEPGASAPSGDNSPAFQYGKRGKKNDEPPADLSALAEDIG
jgi:hypothetical protein